MIRQARRGRPGFAVPYPRPVDELAEQSEMLRRFRAFAEWAGEGRKLTQSGRITLTDARTLVPLLETGDTIDAVIGARMFRTRSTQELPGLNLIADWARSARLVRVVKGRVAAVQKNRALLRRPLALWDRAFEVFGSLGETICHSHAPLAREFEPAMNALLSSLYGGPLRIYEACAVTWQTAGAQYDIETAPELHQKMWRRGNDGDTVQALHALALLGAVELTGTDPDSVARLTALGVRGVRIRLGEAGPGDPVHPVTVTLFDVADPPVWRRLAVSAGITLDRLHAIIQVVMGWQDRHLHVFEAGGVRYGVADPELELTDERQVTLAELVTGESTKIEYTYDLGAGWHHEILVGRALTAGDADRYPSCLAGRGGCPPEDCGGPGGYERLREILADPHDPEHEHMLDWLGIDDAADFDPDGFDLAGTDEALRRIPLSRGHR